MNFVIENRMRHTLPSILGRMNRIFMTGSVPIEGKLGGAVRVIGKEPAGQRRNCIGAMAFLGREDVAVQRLVQIQLGLDPKYPKMGPDRKLSPPKPLLQSFARTYGVQAALIGSPLVRLGTYG